MFILPFIAAASFGLSLWEGISGADDQRDQAKYMKESIGKEMELLRKQRGELSSQYDIKGEQVRDQYGNRMTSLLEKVNQNVLKTEESKRDSTARTGLSYSGTIQRKAEIETTSQRRAGATGQKSLLNSFNSNMLDLSMSETREMGGIDQRLAGLEGQYKAADAAEDTKFLGIF